MEIVVADRVINNEGAVAAAGLHEESLPLCRSLASQYLFRSTLVAPCVREKAGGEVAAAGVHEESVANMVR